MFWFLWTLPTIRALLKWTPTRNLLVGLDKKAADSLGWSGRYTISAECGRSGRSGCKLLCRLLNLIDRDHCAKAARNEGLL